MHILIKIIKVNTPIPKTGAKKKKKKKKKKQYTPSNKPYAS
jgi:hypothetical protein